jgi:neutral ceramidase
MRFYNVSKQIVTIIFLMLSINVSFAQSAFRAAVVKTNITPDTPQWLRGYNPRQSTEILDSLYVRIIALADGKTQMFLISTDVVGMPSREYERLTATLKMEHGIDPLNVWWGATHTHSAPEIGAQFQGIPYPSMANRSKLASQHEIDTVYTNLLRKKIVDGIVKARNNLAPATLSVGWGFSQANINRRAIDITGKASLGLNPDGPTDRRIGLIRIDKANGKPLALIVNYPMHGTVMGGESTVISGDAPGVASKYVEEQIGAPVLYFNGAAGNLAPIYSVYPNHRSGHLSEFRVLLGDKVLEANRKMTATTGDIKLVAGEIIVESPRRPGLGWSPDLARYTSTTSSGVNMVRLPIRFLRLNEEIALWSAPVEMFCEISNEIRDRSPFHYTFYFGYTNGSLGYLPTAEAWESEGYEPNVSPFTPAVEKDLIEAVSGYLEGELKSY